MPPLKTFKGTSKNGNLQKALDLAIQAAQQAAPGADREIIWTLKEVSGRQGGRRHGQNRSQEGESKDLLHLKVSMMRRPGRAS